MSFSQFLFEKKNSAYKIQELNESEIYDLVKKHCSNMEFDRPYWRGMRGEADGYILHGESGNRRSINTSNYYTIIIDHLIDRHGKAEWPKRSKSIICANFNNKKHASNFGKDLYAIFPFDETVIGVTPGVDIWDINFRSNSEVKFSIVGLNNEYEDNGIKADNYKVFLSDLKDYLKEADKNDKLYKLFSDSLDDPEKKLKELYFDNIGFKYMKSDEVNNISDSKELWMSGKCIAVNYQTWYKIRNSMK